MAFVCRHYDAAPADVFAVLVEPRTYPDWLIGAAKIRDVDENFPSPGSKFHHVVGVRPVAIPDHSEVLDVEPNRSLTLLVKARPLFAGVVVFRITGDDDGEGCILTCEEAPTFPVMKDLLRPVIDPLIHVRNQRSLRSMDTLVRIQKQRRLQEAAKQTSS
jgi:uncharacterized protein YndB with AHSA1/START domain